MVQNNSIVSASSFTVGSSITVTPLATGGSGAYSYKTEYKRSSASSFASLGTGTSVTFKPGSAGTFIIRVTATDSTGKTAAKDFTVKAVDSSGFVNKSTISYYSYYYKKTSDTSWTVIGSEMSLVSSASFKPTASGSYQVLVKIMDSTGETVEKTFTLSVS